ncbi:hypothetical protein [Reinekea blandensis]|uniref:Solute-binding protein family 3/N-terminal domain-containing protein n=1 Tax=Reinekea blandensis MED297 TaxID=314283 RepID=A4BCR1_9GAMM|nr:hypothetical protein [Reinekea blandensis]EAR09993.1 hypothetical protein MED297_07891 [Reinekea sp. MED297] [Reinekea blandensis MED297]
MNKLVLNLRIAVPAILLLFAQSVWGKTSYPVHGIAYPPFVTEDSSRPGVTVAFLNRLLEDFDAEADMNLLPPARLQATLNRHEFLASLVSPEYVDEAILEFRFVGEPIYRRLFRHVNSTRAFSAIDGATVARLGFLFQNAENDTTVILGGIPISVPNFESAVRMLVAERVDFVLGVEEAVMDAARRLGVADELTPAPVPMQTFDPLVMYVNSSHPQADALVAILNRIEGLVQTNTK